MVSPLTAIMYHVENIALVCIQWQWTCSVWQSLFLLWVTEENIAVRLSTFISPILILTWFHSTPDMCCYLTLCWSQKPSETWCLLWNRAEASGIKLLSSSLRFNIFSVQYQRLLYVEFRCKKKKTSENLLFTFRLSHVSRDVMLTSPFFLHALNPNLLNKLSSLCRDITAGHRIFYINNTQHVIGIARCHKIWHGLNMCLSSENQSICRCEKGSWSTIGSPADTCSCFSVGRPADSSSWALTCRSYLNCKHGNRAKKWFRKKSLQSRYKYYANILTFPILNWTLLIFRRLFCHLLSPGIVSWLV